MAVPGVPFDGNQSAGLHALQDFSRCGRADVEFHLDVPLGAVLGLAQKVDDGHLDAGQSILARVGIHGSRHEVGCPFDALALVFLQRLSSIR